MYSELGGLPVSIVGLCWKDRQQITYEAWVANVYIMYRCKSMIDKWINRKVRDKGLSKSQARFLPLLDWL